MSEYKDPKHLTTDQLLVEISGHFDVFVGSASFEERCLSIATKLDSNEFSKAIILQNDDVQGKGNEHSSTLLKHFEDKGEKVVVSKSNPVTTIDKIMESLKGDFEQKGTRFLVDISTMTHETLLILFKVLYVCKDRSTKVTFVYTDAKDYDPKSEGEDKWLSRGISDIRSVLGYPGEMKPSKKSHLIILSGFEDERAAKLIEMYEPAYLSIGVGDVLPVSEHLVQVHQTYFNRLIALQPEAHHFSFSPTKALSVRDKILDLAKKHSDNNVIIAPLNSKISTIGVALAAITNPQIQICYSKATTYNFENYSTPAGEHRLFTMNELFE